MKNGRTGLILGLIIITFPLLAMKNPIFVDLTIEVDKLGNKIVNNMLVLLQENPKSPSSNNEELRIQILSLAQKVLFYNDEIKKLKKEIKALKKTIETLDQSKYEEIERFKKELNLRINKSCVQKK